MFRIGQSLEGRLGSYVITKIVQNTVWFAKSETHWNHNHQSVVIKSVEDHPRVENERQLLKRFSGRPHIRPLVDEIQNAKHTTIVLKHFEDDLLNATITKTLNRKELRYVLRCVLQALATLHEAGYVHTDIKPDNVLVNYTQSGENRFSDVVLGDLGGTCHVTSEYAKTGTPIGAPMWTSPEVLMEAPWDTSTDIWSFGLMMIALIYGGDFNLVRQKVVPFGHEEYDLEVLKQQFRYFGPFPGSIGEAVSEETATAILYLMSEIPFSQVGLFQRITEKEICKADKTFISKIMRMDWRERPSAEDLLKDDWFLDRTDST